MTTASVFDKPMDTSDVSIGFSWNQIVVLAQSKDLRKVFGKEVLSRFDDAMLQDKEIYRQITAIFLMDRSLIQVFIQLASTYKIQYYTKDELNQILELFFDFAQRIEGGAFPGLIEKIPHYDQGGKDWIIRCIKALNISKSPAAQLYFLFNSPVVHRNLCAVHLTESDLPGPTTINLSVNRAFAKCICAMGNSPIPSSHLSTHAYVDFVKELKSGNAFSESDQAHLLQIVQAINIHHPTSLHGGGEKTLALWYKAVKETLGETTFMLVSNPPSFASEPPDVQGIVRMLQWIVEIGDDADLHADLLAFYQQKTNLVELLDKLEDIKQEIELKKYPEKDIEEVLQAFASPGEGLVSILNTEELDKLAHQFAQVDALCKKLRKCDISELANEVRAIRLKNTLPESEKMTLIAIAREAIRLKFKIYPFNTQVLALLGLLNYPRTFKGRIAQVRAGEGKSTVVTMLAFYHASLGDTVDIISSSRYLAKRDRKKYREFYQLFGIPTSHICTNDPTEENFNGQIIFGTNSDFEFAEMWDYVREKRLREGGRSGNVVIVDEVDNLFIDTALNSARISIPSEGKYGWVYEPILNFIKENFFVIFGGQAVVPLLREKLGQVQEGKFKHLLDQIEDAKLAVWLSSATSALMEYKVDREYVVKPIERNSWVGKITEQSVVLADKDHTGRLMFGMRAAGGVHEFLEAKHNVPIHAESLVHASLSHPIFYAKYPIIYGLTGTLGSQIERKEVESLYQVDTFDVPPHKKNIREALPTLILHSKQEYFSAIITDILGMVQRKRPTLILFESIKKSDRFALFLKDKGMNFQILNERQLEHEYFIIARAGAPGMITVATNTAGRGTDIILHPDSLQNGGLHVIFAFYPNNDRVEEQGVCRGARQGQQGSARMILISKGKCTLDDFVLQREHRTKKLSKMRMQKIDIERINHGYLKVFLTAVRRWHDTLNTDCLKNVCHDLVKIVEAQPICVPTADLKGADLKLSQEFFRFLERPHRAEPCFEQFVRTARESLLEKILLVWAEGFYAKLEDFSTQKKGYAEKVKALYADSHSAWEKYLQDPVEGFREYLRMITSISLKKSGTT